MQPCVIAIAGPTASGKSDLALALAERLHGEIVCMDSMQIYRRMDIGTAKPTAGERARVPHYMLDIVEPTQPYAVADYAVEAERAIAGVLERGRLPLLVGGTGLYHKALMHGLSLGGVGSDEALRGRLNELAAKPDGKLILHERLRAVDPVSARKLHPNDLRRVIRALEVFELTGQPISAQRQEPESRPFRMLTLALDVPREALYARLEARVHRMLALGLLQEVCALLESGVREDMQSMQGIGYKELVPVARGEQSLEDAAWQIILHTRHYAKRQCTWLRGEEGVRWLSQTGQALMDAALGEIDIFLERQETQA